MKTFLIASVIFIGTVVSAQVTDYNPNRDPIMPERNVSGLKIVYPKKETSICLCCNKDSKLKPLIVVNGKIISNEDFDLIDAEKIKSMTVWKDGKAIEMYGDEGKNGVIVIKAKRNWKKREISYQKPKEEPVLAI